MDSGRRSTKIPLPPGTNVLTEQPASKLNAKAPVTQAKPATLASDVRHFTACASLGCCHTAAQEAGTMEEPWEVVAEQTGWTISDCLSHKLSFKKRDDPKIKLAAMTQHIRRLRAAGRHLTTLFEKHELDISALRSALESEERARQTEASAHNATVATLHAEIAQLEAQLAAKDVQLQAAAKTAQESKEEADGATLALNKAVAKLTSSEEERGRLTTRAEEAESVAKNLTELHQQAQKYQSQLQDYNAKLQGDVAALNDTINALRGEKATWSEETAGLKGKVTALEAQLTALTSSEAAAKDAAAQAAVLARELASATTERERLTQQLQGVRDELDRIKAVSGSSVEELAQEREVREVLESRTKAQAQINSNLQNSLEMVKEQKALAEGLAEQRGQEVERLTAAQSQASEQLEAALRKVAEGEKLRRKLHNTILELKGNIRVFCRVRPAHPEVEEALMPTGEPVCHVDDGDAEGCTLDLHVFNAERQQVQAYNFAFDRVFGPSAGQLEVFEEIEQLVQSAMDGYKVCIFAYGQTGSGKTHTMLGRPGDHGMIPRAMDMLFATSESMGKQGWRFEMRASMLEIYNEEYKDLLGKGPPAGKKHQVTHSANGTTVSFLDVVDVSKPQKVAVLLDKAMQQRAVGATAVNEHSSRSHFVFMLQIDGVNERRQQEVHGALNLIDLAGSERLSRSLATGERLKETQNINKSLSALGTGRLQLDCTMGVHHAVSTGDVIMALATKEQHIPYRNSKLTYLLQPCLGGDAKTLMFANVAPTVESAQETLCSLRFAAKVNACEVGQAKRNMAPRAA